MKSNDYLSNVEDELIKNYDLNFLIIGFLSGIIFALFVLVCISSLLGWIQPNGSIIIPNSDWIDY